MSFKFENMLPFNCPAIFFLHDLFPPMGTDSYLMLFLINLGILIKAVIFEVPKDGMEVIFLA